jgi:hypothetical protein
VLSEVVRVRAGHLAVLVMVLIYTSAMESVRRPYFEAFWFTHHLFIIWFGLLLAHGAMSNLETTTVWAWIAGMRSHAHTNAHTPNAYALADSLCVASPQLLC